jgi:DNA-binding NarL/FixJ family response regulator
VRVLHVEDDEVLQRATRRLLAKLYESPDIVQVDTAAAAVEALAATDFDLVISDYDLREGTGGDVFAWITENRPHLVARFVFLSADERAPALARTVVKPCTVAELRDELLAIAS